MLVEAKITPGMEGLAQRLLEKIAIRLRNNEGWEEETDVSTAVLRMPDLNVLS